MKVVTTPREMMDKGVWDAYCNLTGTSVYAVNEGMPSDEKVELTVAQACEIRLIQRTWLEKEA